VPDNPPHTLPIPPPVTPSTSAAEPASNPEATSPPDGFPATPPLSNLQQGSVHVGKSVAVARKNNFRVVVFVVAAVVLVVVIVSMIGNHRPSAQLTQNNNLTNNRAQGAINQWNGGNSTIAVTGVLDLPQENSARADLTFTNFAYHDRDPFFGQVTTEHYSGPGAAAFSHYNDGRWVLTQVVLTQRSNLSGPIHWDNINVVASAEAP